MKRSKGFDVPVQKGRINPNPPTMKTTLYPERVRQREEQLREIRRGQTTDLVTPRKGRK